MTLYVYSFHSVKGGVGKSTLSLQVALYLAQVRGIPTTLVDMDIMGTSLADGLPLLAPCWPESKASEPLDLQSPPREGALHSRARTRWLMDHERRQLMDDQRKPVGVPFLNDYFLHATEGWDGKTDIPVASLAWRLQGASAKLQILPSSGLPEDLEQILPTVLNEHYSGFLQSRLVSLLATLANTHGPKEDAAVVLDTPPTIPGISRAVLGLALRLGTAGADAPPPLANVSIQARSFLVTTMDMQDLRTSDRWLGIRRADQVLRPLINRVQQSEELHLRTTLHEALYPGVTEVDNEAAGEEPGPEPTRPSSPELFDAFKDVVILQEKDSLRLFRKEQTPAVDEEVAEKLGLVSRSQSGGS